MVRLRSDRVYAYYIVYSTLYMFLAAHEVFVSTFTLSLALALSVISGANVFFHFARYKLMSISGTLRSQVHRSIDRSVRGSSVGPSVEAIAWRQFCAKCYSKYLLMGVFPVLFAENFAFR